MLACLHGLSGGSCCSLTGGPASCLMHMQPKALSPDSCSTLWLFLLSKQGFPIQSRAGERQNASTLGSWPKSISAAEVSSKKPNRSLAVLICFLGDCFENLSWLGQSGGERERPGIVLANSGEAVLQPVTGDSQMESFLSRALSNLQQTSPVAFFCTGTPSASPDGRHVFFFFYNLECSLEHIPFRKPERGCSSARRGSVFYMLC